MSLTINSNQASSISLRAVQQSQNALERALTKLSTGQRVPSARYDAAALAVSSRIRGELVSLQKQALNAQQGAAMLQVAEGAYQRVEEMLGRMRALASQAQGSNLSVTERGMLNTEYQQIKAEITRISKATGFSGTSLFDTGSNLDFGTTTITSTLGNNNAFQLAEADFNGDGYIDIIQNDANNGALTLSLGNGDGTFRSATIAVAATGSFGFKVMTGDFNGDGITDIAAADNGGVRLYTNSGTGQFTSYATFATATDFTVGDFNGDGKDDIAASTTSSNLSIYSSNSTGGYSTSTITSILFDSANLVAADFNNDGRIDIGSASTVGGGRVGIATNTGNGFTVGTTSAFSAIPIDYNLLRLSDINNDGLIDLVVGDSASNNVFIYRGAGNGTFRSAFVYTVTNANQADALVAGDFNGDGYADIITYDNSTGSMFFAAGTSSSGTFENAVEVSGGMYAMMAVDLNRDGRLDLLGNSGGSTNRAYTMLNRSTMGLEGSIRVGSNASTLNNVSFRAGSTRLNSLDNQLESSMINGIGSAKRAEASIKRALQTLTIYRTGVAASINRLEKVQDNIANMIENQEGSRSALADLDVAAEMSAFTAHKITLQAGISMVAQSSKTQRLIATLLGGDA